MKTTLNASELEQARAAFDLPQGVVRLRIDVCNTQGNRLDGRALPSGPMGPVCILR